MPKIAKTDNFLLWTKVVNKHMNMQSHHQKSEKMQNALQSVQFPEINKVRKFRINKVSSLRLLEEYNPDFACRKGAITLTGAAIIL